MSCASAFLSIRHISFELHRDVKLHNILVYQDANMLRLIDWDLAEFYRPKKE